MSNVKNRCRDPFPILCPIGTLHENKCAKSRHHCNTHLSDDWFAPTSSSRQQSRRVDSVPRSPQTLLFDRTHSVSRVNPRLLHLECPMSHPVLCDKHPNKSPFCSKTTRDCMYRTFQVSTAIPRIRYDQQYGLGVVFLHYCIACRVLQHIDSNGFRRVFYLFADDHSDDVFHLRSRHKPRATTSQETGQGKPHFVVDIHQVLNIITTFCKFHHKKLDIFLEYTLSSQPMTQQQIRQQHQDVLPSLLGSKSIVDTIIRYSPKSQKFQKDKAHHSLFAIHHADLRRGDFAMKKIHDIDSFIFDEICDNSQSSTPLSKQQLCRVIQNKVRQRVISESLTDSGMIHDIFVHSKIYKEILQVKDRKIKDLLLRKAHELERYHYEFFNTPQKMTAYIRSQINQTQQPPIQQNLVKMTAYIMDVYTMARMFKTDSRGMKKSHCVYIAGDGHLDHLTELLQDAGASILYDQSHRKLTSGDTIPIDISPLFTHDFWFV